MRTRIKFSKSETYPWTIELHRPIAIVLFLLMVPNLLMNIYGAHYIDALISSSVLLLWPYLWHERISIWSDRIEVKKGVRFLGTTETYPLGMISDLLAQRTASPTQRGFFAGGVLSFKYQKRIQRILGGGNKTDAQTCADWIEAARKGDQ